MGKTLGSLIDFLLPHWQFLAQRTGARVRSKDSRPEMLVRRLVFALGYGALPRSPDLVFRPRRKVIFVHGCFWHRHANCALVRTNSPTPRLAVCLRGVTKVCLSQTSLNVSDAYLYSVIGSLFIPDYGYRFKLRRTIGSQIRCAHGNECQQYET
jgi:hypothetical protein